VDTRWKLLWINDNASHYINQILTQNWYTTKRKLFIQR